MLNEAQIQVRTNGPNDLPRMTGSVIAAAIGLSPWTSPLEQYGRLLGEVPPQEASAPMKWGTEMEALGFAHAQEVTGLEPVLPADIMIPGIENHGGTLLHPKRPEWADSPDGLLLDSKGQVAAALEIKTPTHRTWDQWGEPGTEEIPIQYLAQCQWHMEHTGTRLCWVVAAIDYEWVGYPVRWDQDLWELIVSGVDRFYKRLLDRDPPEADGSASAKAYLDAKFPRVKMEDLLTGGEQESKLAQAYADLGSEIKALKKKQDEAKHRLCQVIGDAPGLLCQGHVVKWSETKRGRSFRVTERKDQ